MTQGLKIIFAGTPEFAASTLQALVKSPHQVLAVFTQPDRPAGRGRKPSCSAVKHVANQHQLSVLQPEKMDDQAIQQIQSLQADVMVVSAYGLLLPKQVIDLPRLGCINIHASLLPAWRGAAPIQRAIINGDKETGITIMQMVEALDAGPILYQMPCLIREHDTSASLHDRLAEISANEIDEVLSKLQNKQLKETPQNNKQATYAKKLSKSEANINWQEPAILIERKIRAFNSWPVAYTYLDDKRLRIWKATVKEDICTGQVGEIQAASKDGIEVVTGDGLLCLQSLQLPGGKVISAEDFINAYQVKGKVLTTERTQSVISA